MVNELGVAADEAATGEVVSTPDAPEVETTTVEATEPTTDGVKTTADAVSENDGKASQEDAEKKSRHQRRKEQIARAKQEAEAAQKALEDRNEALRKAREQAQTAGQPPKEDEFSSYEEYLVALGSFHSMKSLDQRSQQQMEAEAKETEKTAEQAKKAHRDEVMQSWQDQVAEAKATRPDFEQVVYSMPISDELAFTIAQMDKGAEVAYALATNPATLTQMASMSPIEQAMELGRIEARMSSPKPKTQSTAPDPITPLKGKASPTKDPSKMTPAEYSKWREGGGTI